jgi:ABC-2 type transport system ATP-binding protein
LIAAICPETDLLVLDEPTSGLDPIVRREFIETVIGAYQEDNLGNRTIFVSTHLITEFEGLIDEFTIIDQGRVVATVPYWPTHVIVSARIANPTHNFANAICWLIA